VRSWKEWMAIFLPAPGTDITADEMKTTNEEYLARVREMIRDKNIKTETLDVSKWWINEIFAEYYSDAIRKTPLLPR
jgi:hypothetical protein